jgi:hypothetical protein
LAAVEARPEAVVLDEGRVAARVVPGVDPVRQPLVGQAVLQEHLAVDLGAASTWRPCRP